MVIRYLYVYILQFCDGLYYTGVTNDLDQRIIEHNSGIDKDPLLIIEGLSLLNFMNVFLILI